MENCKNCSHAIFDPLWGEYKCEVRRTILYILLDADECSSYDKRTGEIRVSKDHNGYLESLDE